MWGGMNEEEDLVCSLESGGKTRCARENIYHEEHEGARRKEIKMNNGMDIGVAISEMRAGSKVARKGWNGKGQWVVLMAALSLPPYSSQVPGAKVNDRTAKFIGEDTPLESQPYFALWNAQGKWQPGWVPSVSDCLADDWEVVE